MSKAVDSWLSPPLDFKLSSQEVHIWRINRAQLQNSQLQLIPWLVEHHRSMGLVKAVRRRHRTNALPVA